MGNYYSGNLIFNFNPKYKEIYNDLVEYAKLLKIDADNATMLASENFVHNYSKSIISEGFILFRSPDWCLRRPSVELFIAFHNSDGQDLGDYYELDEVIDEMLDEGSYNKMLNLDSISSYVSNVYDESIVCISLAFRINEKNFKDDLLEALIDLWSPYLYGSEIIGVIGDENHTFKKEYRIGNSVERDHWDFCGEWCGYYSLQCSCTRESCKTLYQQGYNDAIRNIGGEQEQ